MTDAPRISDDEVALFRRMCAMHPESTVGERFVFKQALSAFLLARVPPRSQNGGYKYSDNDPEGIGFNACIDQVMKGRGG